MLFNLPEIAVHLWVQKDVVCLDDGSETRYMTYLDAEGGGEQCFVRMPVKENKYEMFLTDKTGKYSSKAINNILNIFLTKLSWSWIA